MGLRDSFVKLLSRGEDARPDPDEWCELVTVPQFEAPLLMNRLEQHGIDSIQRDAFDVVTKSLTKVTIMVKRSALPAAEEITLS
jgi:hypothetical protein